MIPLEESTVDELEQRQQDLEDVGLKPTLVGNFLTVLAQQLEIDLPLRVKSTPAAATFLQSYHTGHSEALQHVRSDELLTALFEDIHAFKIEMMPVYEQELATMEANELDEEDIAMTETLGRRLKGLEGAILKIAEMRENSANSFEYVKATAELLKKEISETMVSKTIDNSASPTL